VGKSPFLTDQSSVRSRARAEGIQRLADHKSLAGRLTLSQVNAIADDAPFEVKDTAHPALQPE
jgi:hypothetical protein